MSENKALVKLFNLEVIEKGNFNLFNNLVSSEFINHTAPAGAPKTKEAFLSFFTNILHFAFSEISVEIHDQIEEKSKVVTRKTIRGTHTGIFFGHAATKRKVEINVTDIVLVKNGQYSEHWGSADIFGAIAQITAPTL